jgi:hypothetical protein
MQRQTRLSTRRGAASQRASAVGWILWFIVPAVVSCAALLCILSFVLTLETETPSLETPEEFSFSSPKALMERQKEAGNILTKSTRSDHREPHKQKIRQHHDEPIVIAYAISLIKCGDFQSSTAGLQDAALVLKHSIHQTSVRNPHSGSHYDYKAYAIVHRQAEKCAQELADAGYELVIRDPPVDKSMIRGDYLRKKIHKEWCW